MSNLKFLNKSKLFQKLKANFSNSVDLKTFMHIEGEEKCKLHIQPHKTVLNTTSIQGGFDSFSFDSKIYRFK